MDKVESSILKPAIVDRRVIPNGVDLAVFKPGNQAEARQRLGLATDTKIILVVANGLRENPYKDYRCLRAALAALSDRVPNPLCLALGEDSPPETIGRVELRFLPFLESRETLADYYRAADVYVHAARADTFPSTVLEALACGCPVAATAVGGIPEQIRRNETGLLSEAGDTQELSANTAALLEHPHLRQEMGARAAEDARARFSVNRMCDAYLDWYREIPPRADYVIRFDFDVRTKSAHIVANDAENGRYIARPTPERLSHNCFEFSHAVEANGPPHFG
jgi:glycosyltransferase involved in cell wall biosynthesis